jgi:YVTN family beta-propeller protein
MARKRIVTGSIPIIVLLIAIVLLLTSVPVQAELVKKMFVTCENNAEVFAVDPYMVNQSTKIGVGSQPRDLAVDSGGKYAYVLNYGDNDISVVDLANGNIVKTIDLEETIPDYHPFRIVTDPQRNYAYVAASLTGNPDDCVIFVLNMNTGLVSKCIESEKYIQGSGGVRAIAVVYYGGTPYLFITHYYDNELVIYNLNTYGEIGSVNLFHHYGGGDAEIFNTTDIAFSVNGQFMYVSHKNNVSMFLTEILLDRAISDAIYSTGNTISTSGVAGEVKRLLPDSASTSVYLSCAPNTIAIADAMLSRISVTVPVSDGPNEMVLDNNTLYACDSDSSISVVDLSRKVEIGRIKVGSMPSGIVIQTVDVPVPIPSPSPTPLPVTTVNVTVEPNSIAAGSDAQVKVTVMNGTTPLKNSFIRVSSTGGTVRTPSGTTTSDGVFLTNFTSLSSGRFDLTISTNTSGYQDQSSSAVIVVNPVGAKILTLNVTVNPKEMTVGSEASIAVKIMDNDAPVSGATVSFISSGGKVTRLIPTTASDGTCYAKFSSNASGSFVLTVTANKSDYEVATANTIVTVAPASVNVLTMNVTVSPQPVVIGNESVITVTVMNGTQPVNGARVELTSTFGSVTPLSGLTTSDGRFLAKFKPGSYGFGFLTASVNATGFERATSSTAVEAASAAPKKLYINMTIDPKAVDVNNGATVIISVTDGVKPLGDARINVTCNGGSIVPAYGKTDSDGKYNAKFIPDDAGTYNIAVVATATGFEQASSSTMVDATESLVLSDFVFWIALIIVILAILIIAIVWFLRKWLRKSLVIVPKKTRIPADGTTKVPVRVQYVNGFGMPSRMRSDLDVELEATSGTIKSVTLPSRRDYVDTDLTASKEFGTVSITAKSGRDVASAEVLFVVDNGSLEVGVAPDSIPADGKSSASITVKVKDGKGNYVKPLEDTVIEFNTSLGDAVSSVYMPAGDQSANATIFSGDMTGISVVTASMGNLRGEAKIEFRGLPKRFCMNCGSPMTLDAQSCPSCGKNPPSGVDTKQCMTCGTVIPEQAQFCHKCGSMQNVRMKVPPVGGLN